MTAYENGFIKRAGELGYDGVELLKLAFGEQTMTGVRNVADGVGRGIADAARGLGNIGVAALNQYASTDADTGRISPEAQRAVQARASRGFQQLRPTFKQTGKGLSQIGRGLFGGQKPAQPQPPAQPVPPPSTAVASK